MAKEKRFRNVSKPIVGRFVAITPTIKAPDGKGGEKEVVVNRAMRRQAKRQGFDTIQDMAKKMILLSGKK